jgi:hypothetical protein
LDLAGSGLVGDPDGVSQLDLAGLGPAQPKQEMHGNDLVVQDGWEWHQDAMDIDYDDPELAAWVNSWTRPTDDAGLPVAADLAPLPLNPFGEPIGAGDLLFPDDEMPSPKAMEEDDFNETQETQDVPVPKSVMMKDEPSNTVQRLGRDHQSRDLPQHRAFSGAARQYELGM